MIKKQKGLKRIYHATLYSVSGLKASWRSEAAVRQEFTALLILIPTAFFVTSDTAERLILISSVVLILITELLNTAIEALADKVSLEFHELIRKTKDIASAAVFVAILLALFAWGLVITN